MSLTREQILEAARNVKMPRKMITVPILGETWVRGMSAKERDKHEEGMRIKVGRKAGQVDLKNFRAKRAVQLIVNEQGERILNDGDADLVGNFPDSILDQILGEVAELSGLDEEENAGLGNASASPAVSDAPSST